MDIFKFSYIYELILPFFVKYLIKGVKRLDFLDWYRVDTLMSKGYHLTSEGTILIRSIKEKSNRERST